MNTPTPVEMRDGDETGKLFVGGLSWETTHATLLKYFSRYGEVIDCVVMKNQQTGKSRGFGFVKFRDPDCVDTVLANGPHILDQRQIDPKACNPRSMNKGPKSSEKNKNKIFLGGLPTNCNESQIKETFGQFGKVTDVVIMFDQEKQKSRGFGFLSFETEEAVDRVCQQQYVQVAGKKVECKKAEPRDMAKLMNQGMFAFASPGLLSANGHPLGLPGMLPMAGVPGLSQLQHGLTLLPSSPLIPLTSLQGVPGSGLSGAGLAGSGLAGLTGAQMAGAGLAGAGITGAGLTGSGLTGTAAGLAGAGAAYSQAMTMGLAGPTLTAWPTQAASSAQAEAESPTNTSASGATLATQLLGVDTAQAQQDRGYMTTSPVQSTTPGPSSSDSGHGEKTGYLVYNGQPGAPLGLFGSYTQEASSYGPARMMDIKPHIPGQTPYSASITYAAPSALAHLPANYLPGAYSTVGAGYGGMALPLAYGGHGDAPSHAYATAAIPARSISLQSFHPYRRADDGR